MRRRTVALAVGALCFFPVGTSAQNAPAGLTPKAPAGTDAQIQLELRRQRMIVHPRPSPEQVVHDAAVVDRDLQEPKPDTALRDPARLTPARPDLGYDVYSAIQSQNVQRALRR